jgi:dipeptidyl-peptidase-4
MAAGGDCPLDLHLYRTGLDGAGQTRLTREPGGHRVWVSPDGAWFVTTHESVTEPPVTALYSVAEGRVATLAEPQTSRFDELSLEPPELFSFTAGDGVTPIYGVLSKPSDFDPARRYPLVIDVYGGPSSQRVRQRYRPANPSCEFGFLVAAIDNRGTGGRGKAFEESVYLQCGTMDLEDQANGVRHLAERPYVDGGRVGIFGHSYGGYMAALAILKHPDVFGVSVASSPVTDWRHYDTIYTERYMRTPQENPDGYDAGSCLTYAKQLRGKLLLMHGMVDDNVHPNNSWQLVDALHKAGRPFSMMFFPDGDHGLGGPTNALRWEFLYDHLIGQERRGLP